MQLRTMFLSFLNLADGAIPEEELAGLDSKQIQS